MKARRHIVPEQDFAFAAETFTLCGELAVEIVPEVRPFQADCLELFPGATPEKTEHRGS